MRTSPTKYPDEWGATISALATLAGLSGVATKLGLSPDQVLAGLGAAATLVATARALGRRWLAAQGR